MSSKFIEIHNSSRAHNFFLMEPGEALPGEYSLNSWIEVLASYVEEAYADGQFYFIPESVGERLTEAQDRLGMLAAESLRAQGKDVKGWQFDPELIAA